MVTQRPAETDHEKSTDRRELPHLRSSGHMASSLLWGLLPELHEELENARTSESDLGSNSGSSLPCDWGRGFEGSPSLGFLGLESHLGILLTQRAVVRSQLNCHCGLPSIGEAFEIDPSPFPSSSFLAIVFLCYHFWWVHHSESYKFKWKEGDPESQRDPCGEGHTTRGGRPKEDTVAPTSPTPLGSRLSPWS